MDIIIFLRQSIPFFLYYSVWWWIARQVTPAMCVEVTVKQRPTTTSQLGQVFSTKYCDAPLHRTDVRTCICSRGISKLKDSL